MRLFNSIRLAYFQEYEKDAKSKGKSGDHDYLGEWVDGEDLDGKSWTPRIPVSDTKKKGDSGSRSGDIEVSGWAEITDTSVRLYIGDKGHFSTSNFGQVKFFYNPKKDFWVYAWHKNYKNVGKDRFDICLKWIAKKIEDKKTTKGTWAIDQVIKEARDENL